VSELPQPKGFVRAVVAGVTRQTAEAGSGKKVASSLHEVREPFLHLYSEDPHTIVEIRGPRFECAWLKDLAGMMGDQRWLRLSERFAGYYGAKLDTTLMGAPEEPQAITAALNVDPVRGQGGGAAGGAKSVDDTPVVLAASRVIVYTLVYGV
jgi:hypothetical protein